MIGIEPKFRTAQTRWYKRPVKGGVYLAALDPSLGTGGDYASIEVYEATTMEQVAEWQHNKTPINRQVKVLQDILTYIAYETIMILQNLLMKQRYIGLWKIIL